MRHLVASIPLLVACGSVVAPPRPGGEPPPPPGGQPPSTARCNPNTAFGTPTGRDFATSSTGGATPALSLSGDELEAVIANSGQLLSARRPALTIDFDAVDPAPFADFNVDAFNEAASLTGDALHLYFLSPDGFVFHATRSDRDAAWRFGGQVFVDGAPLLPGRFAIASDGQTLYWVDANDGQLRSALGTDDVTFDGTVIASTEPVSTVVLDASETVLYHATGGDILVSTRASVDEAFGPGSPLAELNTGAFEAPLAVSLDDCVLYFQSDRPGHLGLGDVWKASRPR